MCILTWNVGTFSLISSYAHRSHRRLRGSTEEGRPYTVLEVWGRFVHCVACRVRSNLFFGGGGQDDFPGFLFEAFFCTRYPPFSEKLVCFAHTYLYENGTACHNSGFPVQGQVWGIQSFKFGCSACRVPCFTRACAVWNEMIFFLKKKTYRRSKLLGVRNFEV